MKETVLDLQALKTFVLGMEFNSFALAAKHQHKSTSAVSAHLKKLEQQTNAALVRKEGRLLVPTAQGEQLLSYGKKMVVLNDEALEALRWVDLQGAVSVGLQEDFSQGILTECLARFSRINDQVQLNTMIERYATLISSVQDGSLDVSVTWQGHETTPYVEQVADTAIHWIAAPDFPLTRFLATNQPVPLVVIEPNCLFKQKATATLDAAGIRWKVVYQSQSLSGIWPAVNAGFGITARPRIGCPDTLETVDGILPGLGKIGIQLHRSKQTLHSAGEKLIESMTSAIQASYG